MVVEVIMDKDQLLEKILCEPRELSDDQKKAVTSEAKYLRVIAGAGAGKTETLTRRIAYLLLCEEVDPSKIVAFTFTEKAAQSMKSRLYQRISQVGREDILRRLGEMYIGTIHGYCLRLLEDHFGFGDYDVFDENQEIAFLLRYGWSLGLNNLTGPYSRNCDLFLNSINVAYNEILDREELRENAPDFYDMLIKYENLLDTHHRLTFSRMGYEALVQLEQDPEKIDHIDYLIVDEFQDINNAQFKLIELIGQGASVFVVGDPRQSIYQWRGSNERFFLDFDSCFSGAETVDICENWRSAGEIVRVSNHFADWFRDVEYGHLNSKRDTDGELTKLCFNGPIEEGEWVADQIDRLVRVEKKCKYSDFGILMRSVNTSAEPFIQAFRDRNIPYLVGGKVGLFKRDEAQAVGRLISWVSDAGFWVESPFKWGDQVNGEDLLTSGLNFWENVVDFPLSEDIEEELETWKENVLNKKYPDFKSVYHNLLITLGYLNLDPANRLHVAIMANLGRFSSLLGDFEVSRRLGGGRISWKDDIKNLCWFMNSYASTSYDEQAVDDLRKVDAVQISTVHQAKGLEWPVVFVPALVSRRFPSSMAGRQRDWLIPREMFDVARYEGGEEEEKRLFYVAITRAMDTSILSYFNSMNSRRVAQSRFLARLDHISINEADCDSYALDYEAREKLPDEEIQTFSATEIIGYMKCPHHYRMLNLWRYTQSHNPLIGYGDSLHFCLRYASELIKNDGLNPISAVATAVDEKFFLPFAGPTQAEKVKANARQRLIEFATRYEDDMNNIDEVEARLEFPVQNATIVGKVDVILREEPEKYEIRDYKSKTSNRGETEEDATLQVRLYTLGLQNMGRDISKGSVAYLEETAAVKEVTVEENDLQDSKGTAEGVIGNILSGCFDAKPGEFCKQCEYSNICRWSS